MSDFLRSCQCLRVLLLSLVCTALPVVAFAEALFALPNQTPLQTRLGTAIQMTVCPRAASESNPQEPGGDRSNGAVGDLFGRCNDLIQTAQLIEPQSGTGNNSLDIDADQINAALSSIASMQAPAIGKGVSEIAVLQAGVVADRLYALRDGAEGLQMLGSLVDSQGNHIVLDHELLTETSAAGVDSQLPAGLGIFFNSSGGFGDRDSNGEELGFDYHDFGFTAGADYRFSDLLVGGLALGYTNAARAFDRNGGNLRSNSISTSLYGGYQSGALYVDGIYSYTYHSIDLRRHVVIPAGVTTGEAMAVDRRAKGDTGAHENLLAGSAGYQFSAGGFNFGPLARLEYIHLGVNSFDESGAFGLNLSYDEDTVDSLISDIGAEASYAISTGFGVLTPQFRLEWAHQFLDDPRNVTTRYTVDSTRTSFFSRTKNPDRNYLDISLSLAAQLENGISAFVSYETIAAHDDLSGHFFTLGGRIEF